MSRITLILAAILAISLVDLAMGILSAVEEADHWAKYKAKYQKTYLTPEFETFSKDNYNFNKKFIRKHNDLYNCGCKTYRLAVNQFTDMSFIQFKILFQKIKHSKNFTSTPAPTVQPAALSYDPRDMGLKLNIENQGTKCNSGWAYATAKSIELFKAAEAGNKNSSSLSAQNLIDCAGRLNACYNKRPKAAFNYLTKRKMNLYLEQDYKNQNNRIRRGNCIPPTESHQLQVANLTAYTEIRNGSVDSVKSYVSSGIPVVVEFNPTSFEFMHYSEGIFQQPLTGIGSHYMVAVGYGTDKKTNMDYWLLLNSFGTTWGEDGLMKFHQTSNYSIAEYVIYPSES